MIGEHSLHDPGKYSHPSSQRERKIIASYLDNLLGKIKLNIAIGM